MLRNLLALLVSGAMALGMVSPVSAQERATTKPGPPVRVTTTPLAPGGAAGIKQAQAQRSFIWNFAPFALVGGLAALVILMNDDDGDSVTTTTSTGTN